MKQKTFLFGCNYYPYYHTREEMITDFNSMRKVGFNQTRTAEALTSWDRIEPREGEYDWTIIDGLMEQAQKNKFTVILGTGSCCPPHWLVKKYPDIQAVNKDNHKQYLLATYNWACIDHPGYKKAHAKYLYALIERYSSNSALGFWQINNEPGYPFVQEQGMGNIYCYCDYSKAAFQKFLENKYLTIEALNESWQWLATNLWFNSWEDVEMPRATPAAWGAVSPWIDWHQFRAFSWTERFADEAKMIRENDPHHPVLLNSFVYSRWDFFGILLGVNLWELAKKVDIFGSDLYPGIGNRYKKEREYISSKLFLEKSMAKDKPLWIPELESGPIGGYSKGPDHTPKPVDIGRYMAECIGHGAKEISFHGWREWKPQPMHWGGLVDLEGNQRPLVDMVKKVIIAVKSEEHFFLESDVAKQGLAMLQIPDNAVVLQGYGAEDMLKDSIRGFVDLFWSENFYVEFLDPADVENNSIPDHIKVIILPYQLVIGQNLAKGLENFTKKGGTLVGTAKCGMMDHRGWYNPRIPGAGLDRVFGVKEVNVFLSQEEHVVFEGRTFPAYHQCSELEIYESEDTTVFAFFESSGLPAVTKHTYGSGSAWFIGTHPGMAWINHERCSALRDLVLRILDLAGVSRSVWLNQRKDVYNIMDLHVLEWQNERVYIVTNSTDSILEGSIESIYDCKQVVDLMEHKKIPNGKIINLTLNPGEFTIIKVVL